MRRILAALWLASACGLAEAQAPPSLEKPPVPARQQKPLPQRFDGAAFYAAVDAQRKEQGLSWAQLSARLGIAASTLKNMRTSITLEADGVLETLEWIGHRPESFAAGRPADPKLKGRTAADTGRILRLDRVKLAAALDAERQKRGETWEQVAQALTDRMPASLDPWRRIVTAATLKSLATPGRWGFYQLLAALDWLGRPSDDFLKLSLT